MNRDEYFVEVIEEFARVSNAELHWNNSKVQPFSEDITLRIPFNRNGPTFFEIKVPPESSSLGARLDFIFELGKAIGVVTPALHVNMFGDMHYVEIKYDQVHTYERNENLITHTLLLATRFLKVKYKHDPR